MPRRSRTGNVASLRWGVARPGADGGIVTESDDARILEGRRLAKSYAGWAASAGFVPLPLLDVAGLMTTQLSMLRSLARLYGVPFDRERARVVLSAAAGSLAPQGVASVAGISALKVIPGWGGLLGIVAMPALAVASTMAVAEWFIQHLAAGGTLADADPGRPRAERPASPVTAGEARAAPAEQPATEAIMPERAVPNRTATDRTATDRTAPDRTVPESPPVIEAPGAGSEPDAPATESDPTAHEESSEAELAGRHGRPRRSSRAARTDRHGDDD